MPVCKPYRVLLTISPARALDYGMHSEDKDDNDFDELNGYSTSLPDYLTANVEEDSDDEYLPCLQVVIVC